MDNVEIQNLSATELIIEDIGIRLFSGESKLVDRKLFEYSRDYKIHPLKNLIKITKMPPKAPIWPLIPKMENPAPVIAEPQVQIPIVDNSSNEILNKLNDTMNQILNFIKNPTQQISPMLSPISAQKSQKFETNVAEDPMFIPDKIMETLNADARINIQTNEVSKPNFVSSREYLKTLRKDRPK